MKVVFTLDGNEQWISF